MNEYYRKLRKSFSGYFSEYGKVVFLGALAVLFCLTLYSLYTFLSPKKLAVTFLDVGQGDSILISTPSGKQMLIDGGATNVVLEELNKHISYFDRTLDVVVATHPDSDHVTGLIPVFKKYEVETIVTSNVKGDTGIFGELEKSIEEEGAEVRVAQKGDTISFGDGVELRVLYPTHVVASDTNDGSVSIVVTYGEHSFLLTGDLSQELESELIIDTLPKNITVYKAGHHGSRTSSGEVLLSRIHPEYSVISAGKNNDYGHPHLETLERLQKYGREVLSTIDHGAITFLSDGRTLEVKTEK